MPAIPFDFSLPPHDEKILVACSGGADSMALLLTLHEAEFSLVVAHINHGTRGAESDADECFVQTVCTELNLPCAIRRLQLEGKSEAALRDARYAALIEIAHEFSCSHIATGHTATDVLETILLNWIRGATVTGFAGIAPERVLDDGVLLVRPMLVATREEVRDYLHARGWKWREDASNLSTDYKRNRIRHELLPILGELSGDKSTQRLARQSVRKASLWRDDIEFLENAANTALRELTLIQNTDLLVLDGLKFTGLAIALQRRVLRLAAQSITLNARDLESERVEEVRRHVMENRRRAVWQWRRDLRVEWTGEYSGNRLRFIRV